MTKKLRILVVEDETAIRIGLLDVLVFHGYEADAAEDGREGLEKALSGRYDLILLDVMLPHVNGFEICERIRESDRHQAIIMLTAKDQDEDVINGLRLGADDYVAKPFSIAQLVLRIQAVLRRSVPANVADEQIRLNERTHIDVRNLAGEKYGEPLAFTKKEMEVLQYLHANDSRAVSREELLSKVWGYGKNLDIETRTVDIHVAKLRRKIERDHKSPRHLLTVRGAGYRLCCDRKAD